MTSTNACRGRRGHVHLAPAGVWLGGEEYALVRGDGELMNLKRGLGGACVYKTSQARHHPAPSIDSE